MDIKQQPISGLRLLAALGLWVVAASGLGGATVALMDAEPQVTAPVVVAEVYALLIVALVVVVRPSLGRLRFADVALGGLAFAATYLAVAGLEALVAPAWWEATASVLRGIGSDDGRLASAGPVVTAIIMARACGLAAVAEELLFRGAFFQWLRRRASAGVTIGLTAVTFAAIHGYPAVLPLAAVLGVVLGGVRERSGSVLPGIVIHAANNAALMAMSYALTGWAARLPVWGAS